jgi:SSS family solute:Na+ symporter
MSGVRAAALPACSQTERPVGLRDSNLALLTIARKTFPAWFLGVIGGAGALTAMVSAAIRLLTGATLFAKRPTKNISGMVML